MKGQSATEYLMTYGWAILAITIVGALLYTQVFSERSCATEGAAGFPLVNAATVDGNEFAIDAASGNLSVAVKNNVGKDITVTKILKGTQEYDVTDVAIADGATAVVSAPGFSAGTVGECYSEKVTIVYQTATGIDQRSSGSLNGRY
jgi:hypothetical protein